MFKIFKEKLGKWAKNLSKESEKIDLEKPEKKSKKKEPIKKKEATVLSKFDEELKQVQPNLNKLSETAEEIEEKEKPGTESFFQKVTSRIQKIKISEKEFEIYGEELKMLLIENNVAFEVAEKVVEQLKEEIIGKEFLRKEVESEIKETLKKILRDILIEPVDILQKIKEKTQDQAKDPFVFLFVGVNGTGKTTTIAKVATLLKEKGFSCVLAAADTFRAASIEQLKHHGERVDAKVIAHEYGSDPASVGFDAIQYAKKNMINCVLIDTAGRMHTSKNLLKEIEKVAHVCKPDLKIFVGESITGNDSIEQIKSFDWAIKIDGIVLTKADIDEKGGTALSLGYVTKKPILFLGTGQDYKKIELFNKEKFLNDLGL